MYNNVDGYGVLRRAGQTAKKLDLNFGFVEFWRSSFWTCVLNKFFNLSKSFGARLRHLKQIKSSYFIYIAVRDRSQFQLNWLLR